MHLDNLLPTFLVETIVVTLFGGKEEDLRKKMHVWRVFESLFFGAIFDYRTGEVFSWLAKSVGG